LLGFPHTKKSGLPLSVVLLGVSHVIFPRPWSLGPQRAVQRVARNWDLATRPGNTTNLEGFTHRNPSGALPFVFHEKNVGLFWVVELM